jgi:hypothetical protein
MLGTQQAKKDTCFRRRKFTSNKVKTTLFYLYLYPKWLLPKEFPEYINLLKNLMCRNRYPIPGIDNNYLHDNLCQSVFTIEF